MSLRAVSGGGSSSTVTPLQYERFVTPGTDTFTYTDDTRIIYVSGCSGGGGGGGGYSGVGGGGGGGGPAPMYFMLPLELAAGGGTLNLFIGSGGSAGTVGNSGNNGTETTIEGDTGAEILSPFANASNQILMGYGFGGTVGAVGAGGNGGGAIIASTALAHYGTENTGTGHASRWWYAGDGFVPTEYLYPICQGAGGGAVSANGGSRNSAAFSTINGNGFGNSGTGNASGGGGGGGGGGPYGLGGLGGSNAGAAGAGSGFGFGGGGGSGSANGTPGGNGFLIIWY